MSVKARGEEYRSTTVCIDSYDNGVPVGQLHNDWLPEGKRFYSTTGFLIEMERILDDMDCPRAFVALRTFAPPVSGETGLSANEQRNGAMATFTVRILFRQNASWQGSVTWLEGRQEQSFRSVLELILLMDNALSFERVS